MRDRPGGGLLRNDLELLSIVVVWGFNITVVKVGLREIEPLAYNVLRFVGAALVLIVLTRSREGELRVRREDLGRLILLGVVGHLTYQICFIEGVARTTASSTALLFGSTPVVVALLSRLAGHERIGLTGLAGALLGFFGVYLIVGGNIGEMGGASLLGNLLIVGAVLCWSSYTVLARRVLQRYSPLRVTAISLSIGTLLMIPTAIPQLIRQDWASVTEIVWAGLVFSFLFALVCATSSGTAR